MYTQKAQIMDAADMDRAITRISHEIIENCAREESIVLIGIRRRGIPLAEKIAENIKTFSDIDVEVGDMDITLYRDDLTEIFDKATVTSESLNIDINNRLCVIVDDVLYTGRTVRAGMDYLMSQGRPSIIRLAVLIDRGHRELPIRADFVGKNVPTSHRELIAVRIPEYDGKKEVVVMERDGD